MTNRIDWKEMTIAAVGLLALVFNPASESGKAIFAKALASAEEIVEQASARSQEAFAVAQMRMEWARAARPEGAQRPNGSSPLRLRATFVENQACARTARAQALAEAQQARIAARVQAVVEREQARIAARQLRAELQVHRGEFRQLRNFQLVVVKSTDTPQLSF